MDDKVKWVKIKYIESGGFTGLSRSCELNSQEMTEIEGDKLCRLVEQSGILNLPDPLPEQAYYGISYKFELVTDVQAKIVKYSSLTLPEQMQGLLKYISEFSTIQPH